MENTKINGKKLLSLITAGMLMAAPALANAEGNENANSNGFTLVKQEMKVEGYDLDLNKYIAGLEKTFNYLKQFNGPEFEDYEYLQADLQILYYMTNRPYMSTNTNNDLIASDVVYGEEYIKENFHRAFDLLYRINAYNERVIREDYERGTMDINHLIDPSILCFDKHDRKILRSMFEHYFEAYKNGLFENEDYTSLFKELTTLNAQERKHNAFSSETGAMWLEQITIGRQTIEMIHDDLLRDFTMDELSVYFVREKLEKDGEWVLRDDVPVFNQNCMSELEHEIFNLGELETFCYDLVNNNLYKLFNITENIETANETENYADNETVETENNETVENTEAVVSEASQADYSYGACVDKAFYELSSKITYDHLQADLNCLVFLTNREYLTEDEQNDLINQGVVYKTSMETEEGMQTFAQAYQLISIIQDYNQSVIRRDYEEGTMDINHLIDPSIFCMNANDREIVHNLHVAYFEAYKAGRFDNEYYRGLYNLAGQKILPVGPMWMANNIVYADVEQMLRDDMQADYMDDASKRAELAKWFDKKELNAGQWILRGDVDPQADSSDELEREVNGFKKIWPVIYTNANDDIFATFDIYCK